MNTLMIFAEQIRDLLNRTISFDGIYIEEKLVNLVTYCNRAGYTIQYVLSSTGKTATLSSAKLISGINSSNVDIIISKDGYSARIIADKLDNFFVRFVYDSIKYNDENF